MNVLKDYKCAKHGYFEARKAKCPMKNCEEEVMVVFLQAPKTTSSRTKMADKQMKGLADDFKMGDIKTTREGENQGNVMSRNNKFKKKDYEDAERHLAAKAQREPRPGDAAIWGGDNRFNLQGLLNGNMIRPVRDEAVGVMPSQAGIKSGPKIDPRATMRDHENLQIKK